MLIGQSHKSGFTLVELSIVLVIIGLLIGGILVGQSLIESAKINRFVSDLMQYEVAVVQFHNKFKKYPGDSPHFTPPGTGNNWLNRGTGGVVNPATGNGTADCAEGANSALSNWESQQVWAHLSQAGMLSKKYEAYSPATTCPDGVHNNSPSNIANAGIVWPYIEISGAAATHFGQNKRLIEVRKITQGNFNFLIASNPLDALAIEKKLGSKNSVSNNHQHIGLGNHFAVGYCNGGLCTDPNANIGILYYYLAPP